MTPTTVLIAGGQCIDCKKSCDRRWLCEDCYEKWRYESWQAAGLIPFEEYKAREQLPGQDKSKPAISSR